MPRGVVLYGVVRASGRFPIQTGPCRLAREPAERGLGRFRLPANWRARLPPHTERGPAANWRARAAHRGPRPGYVPGGGLECICGCVWPSSFPPRAPPTGHSCCSCPPRRRPRPLPGKARPAIAPGPSPPPGRTPRRPGAPTGPIRRRPSPLGAPPASAGPESGVQTLGGADAVPGGGVLVWGGPCVGPFCHTNWALQPGLPTAANWPIRAANWLCPAAHAHLAAAQGHSGGRRDPPTGESCC